MMKNNVDKFEIIVDILKIASTITIAGGLAYVCIAMKNVK